MPTAPLRPCATAGCPILVPRGHCPRHTRAREQQRGSASARGYTYRWTLFRRAWLNQLTKLALTGETRGAFCGERLPGAPLTTDSRCAQDGRLVAGTELDHIVPHGGDPRLMWNGQNCQLLCAACHAVKTAAGR
jgi:5-methylcytosine-specific restriction enzyme A